MKRFPEQRQFTMASVNQPYQEDYEGRHGPVEPVRDYNPYENIPLDTLACERFEQYPPPNQSLSSVEPYSIPSEDSIHRNPNYNNHSERWGSNVADQDYSRPAIPHRRFEQYPPHVQNSSDELHSQSFEQYSPASHQGPSGEPHSLPASRIHSMHRNMKYNIQRGDRSRLPKIRDARMGGANTLYADAIDDDVLEQHASLIVSKMEQDSTLMENSLISEQMRKDALRDMPQSLTIKRTVKSKLLRYVHEQANSKRRRIGCYKIFKYQTSMFFSKIADNVKNFINSFQLWYGALKTIEGNFGSGVASFFKFLRWLFVMNLFVAVFTVAFVIVPQSTHGMSLQENGSDFSVGDIFTGEGYLTSTILYYGFYSNTSVSYSNWTYSMPHAYFYTILSLFLICFAVLSFSLPPFMFVWLNSSSARSYRRSFIETEGSLKNAFAHKIFCGWDFSISTKDAADLKTTSNYHEFKELLAEFALINRKNSFLDRFRILAIQIIVNVLVFGLMAVMSYALLKLLDSVQTQPNMSVVTAIVVNVIMTLGPMSFGFIAKFEGYKNPRTGLLMTLLRTFLLGCVVIGILVTHWISSASHESCWETSLGQEIYRLVLFDFIISILLSALYDVCLFMFYKCFSNGFLEFDIARHTMQLIYNQALFWVGFFFSPLLSVMVVVKLLLTWYIWQIILLKFCKHSTKSWRAAQTETWFLILTFLSIFLFCGLFGYMISLLPASSNCGPFRNYEHIYDILTKNIFPANTDKDVLYVVLYIVRPGCIALIILCLCVIVYFLRARAKAQYKQVQKYKDILVWQAKDKKYLLQYIHDVTNGQWQFNCLDSRDLDPIKTLPNASFYDAPENGDINVVEVDYHMPSPRSREDPHYYTAYKKNT